MANTTGVSLVWKLVLPIPVVGAAFVVFAWMWVPGQIAASARATAEESALQTVKQFQMLRAYYTQHVVPKAMQAGLKPVVDHRNDPAGIPLPAGLVLDMSDLLSKEDTRLSLTSPYPFSNRAQRKLDRFQQEAWDFLSTNPDGVFIRSDMRDGQPVVRAAVADRMAAQGCLNCHNTMAASPKKDWKLGDVRGVLEVSASIAPQLARGAALSHSVETAIGVGVALLALILLGLTFWSIRPLNGVAAALERLRAGDTEVRVDTRRRDEIGRIAGTVETFRDNLKRTRALEAEAKAAEERAAAQRRADLMALADRFEADVAGVAAGLSGAAAQMQSSAQSMSAVAEQTNRQSTAVAVAAEETSASVQGVATAATELSTSIGEIGRQVAAAATTAGQAAENAGRTNEQVRALDDAAQKIGEVVKLINEIAAQTNLLALNATIEAARAGDAGKGFAVVASEVKGLANETAKATEDIASQVKAIQETTRTAVDAIGSIADSVAEVSKLTAAIAAAVEEQGAATQEIARSTQQASSGTVQVSQNIHGVTDAASETGRAAGDVLAAAGELTKQTVTLKERVASFLGTVRAA